MNNTISQVSLPPFFMSSVPKSGTHLLHQILNGMPNVYHDIRDQDKKFFIDHHVQNQALFQEHFYRLGQLQPNEFGVGHIFYSKPYAYMIKRLQLKHLFIYRDPRDVLVSLAHFIPKKWNEHPFYEEFQQMPVKDRMRKLLIGEGSRWLDFDQWNRPFYQWINDPGTLSVTFEEIVSSPESRHQALLRIVEYLWAGILPRDDYDSVVENMVKQMNPARSNTFRKGKTGAWREEFDEEIKQMFKKVAGRLLIDVGYETDDQW